MDGRTYFEELKSAPGLDSGLTLIIDLQSTLVEPGTLKEAHNGFTLGGFPQVSDIFGYYSQE